MVWQPPGHCPSCTARGRPGWPRSPHTQAPSMAGLPSLELRNVDAHLLLPLGPACSGPPGAGAQGQGLWEQVSLPPLGASCPCCSLGGRGGPPGGERPGLGPACLRLACLGPALGRPCCWRPLRRWHRTLGGVGRQQGFHIWLQDSGGAGRGPALGSTWAGAGAREGWPGRPAGSSVPWGWAQDREGLPPDGLAWPRLPPWGGTFRGGGARCPAQWEGRGPRQPAATA